VSKIPRGEKVRVTAFLSPDAQRRLKVYCAGANIDQGDIISRLIIASLPAVPDLPVVE
jgi:hypothetical protein